MKCLQGSQGNSYYFLQEFQGISWSEYQCHSCFISRKELGCLSLQCVNIPWLTFHFLFGFLCTFQSSCVKRVQIWSLFWSVFSRIWTEHRKIRSIFPYSVRMRENTDQKKVRVWILFTQRQLIQFTETLHSKLYLFEAQKRENWPEISKVMTTKYFSNLFLVCEINQVRLGEQLSGWVNNFQQVLGQHNTSLNYFEQLCLHLR